MGRELSGLVKPTAIQATCSALCDHFASATYFCRRESGRANTTHKTTAAITDADHVGLSSTHSTISQILLVTIVPSTSLLCTNTRGLERSSIGGCYCAVPDRRTDGGRRRLRACRRMPRGQDCLVIGRALSFCASGNLVLVGDVNHRGGQYAESGRSPGDNGNPLEHQRLQTPNGLATR